MTITTAGNIRVIPEPFERAVVMIRQRLSDAGLSVVEEFDISGECYMDLGIVARSSIVLLVDTPMLLVEAIALDRAAAVFLPLHVLILGGQDVSYVHWANPMTSWGLRPPAPAKRPLESICTRVSEALSGLPQVEEGVALPHHSRN